MELAAKLLAVVCNVAMIALVVCFGLLVQPASVAMTVAAYIVAAVLAAVMILLWRRIAIRQPANWCTSIMVPTFFVAYVEGAHWYPLMWICAVGMVAAIAAITIDTVTTVKGLKARQARRRT